MGASFGLVSGRFSTSHIGMPAHSAMNGIASSTLIHSMVIMSSSRLALIGFTDHTAGRGYAYPPNDLCRRYESETSL